jgi:TM2 domain-containing membrane protein YozV
MSSQPEQPVWEQPTPNLNISCPHCRTRLNVHPSQAGAVASCPRCTGKFQVPLPTAPIGGASLYGTYSVPSARQDFVSKKLAAGICGILVGGLGIHKFILGLNTAGAIMAAVTCGCIVGGWVLCGIPVLGALAMMVIGLVEGIIYLTKSDEDFYQTYAIQKKEWF